MANLAGPAALMIRSLGKNIGNIATLDELMLRLRQIFVSPAYLAKARFVFMTRIEQKHEILIAYHATIRTLWEWRTHLMKGKKWSW